MPEAHPTTHLAILGLMGSGKTTVGREVAKRLGWPLVDSDEWIEARTGMTVAGLWHRGGEAAYRPHEQAVVSETLSGSGPDVLTVPAGAVDDQVSLAELRRAGVFCVWLRAGVDTLVERVAHSAHRPLLDEDPQGVLEAQSGARAPAYAALADLVVDVDHAELDQVVKRVIDALRTAAAADGTI